MSSNLLCVVACLLAVALTLSCCQAQPSVCDGLSAGGFTYDLHSLGTITTSTLFSIPGYISASINFCEPADGCGGAYACLTGTNQPLVLCAGVAGPPTGGFLDSNSPQLGATFICAYATPDREVVLKGFVGCGPSEANMAALYTPSTSGSGVSSYNFIVPAVVYCNGSGYSA